MKKTIINIALIIMLIVPCLFGITGCIPDSTPPAETKLKLGNYVQKAAYNDVLDVDYDYYEGFQVITLKENNKADYTGRFNSTLNFGTFEDIEYSQKNNKVTVNFNGTEITGNIVNETTFILEFKHENYSNFNVFEYEDNVSLPIKEFKGTTENGIIINANVTSKTAVTLTIKTSADDTNPSVINCSLKILGNRVIMESENLIYLGCYNTLNSTDWEFYLSNLTQYTKATNSFMLIDNYIAMNDV